MSTRGRNLVACQVTNHIPSSGPGDRGIGGLEIEVRADREMVSRMVGPGG